MLSFTGSYAEALASEVKEQRYTVAIEITDSNTLYLTSHLDSGRPDGANVVDGCIKSVSGGTQRLDSKNTTSSIGGVTLEVIDLQHQISAFLALYDIQNLSIRNKKITFYYGYASYLKQKEVPELTAEVDQFLAFEDVDWLDYSQRFTMIITDFTPVGEKFIIKCSDVQRLEDKTIFLPHDTQLRETVSASSMLIPINELIISNKFPLLEHDADYSDRPSQTVGYVIIEENETVEVITHTGLVDDPEFGVSIQVIERGALGSTAVGHQVNPETNPSRRTKISELIYFEGPALKLLYAIQTRRLIGQALMQSGGEDVFDDNADPLFPEHWSQNIDPSFIRLSDYKIDPIANTSPGSFELSFLLREKQNSFDFIANELMRWVFGLRPVYGNGEIGFKRQVPILSNSGFVAQLTDKDITRYGSMSVGLRDVINDYSISWDQRYFDGIYNRTVRHIDVESIEKYSDGAPRSFKFQGVKTIKNTDQALTNFVEFYRNRFSSPPYRLQISIQPSFQAIEVADNIRVSSEVLRDPILNKNIDRVFEVQRITPSRDGSIKLDLFASGEKPFTPVTTVESFVMDDAFYTSAGSDLASLAEVVGGVLTSDVTIAGGNTYGDGIWYMDGSFEIADNVTLTVTNNVQLRIRGQLIMGGNSTINGVAQGNAGGAGGTTNDGQGASNASAGTKGLGGSQYPGRAYYVSVFNFQGWGLGHDYQAISITAYDGLYSSPPYRSGTPQHEQSIGGAADYLPLVNLDGLSLPLLDNFDGRGLSGNGGQATHITQYGSVTVTGANPPPGGDGGDGGASLSIVSRGLAVTNTSIIDLSGGDSPNPPNTPAILNSNGAAQWRCLGGVGAPGMPGALYVMIDGPGTNNFIRSLNFVANQGVINAPPETTVYDYPLDASGTFRLFNSYNRYTGQTSSGQVVLDGSSATSPHVPRPPALVDASNEMYRHQLIPAPDGLQSSVPAPDYELQPPSAVLLDSDQQYLEIAADGSYNERIRVTWTASPDAAQADQYEVQARIVGALSFRTVAYVANDQLEAFFSVDDGRDYEARVRAVTGRKGSASSQFASSASHTAVGLSQTPDAPTGFTVTLRANVGAVFTVNESVNVDFRRFIFFQGATFATATRLFDSSSTESLSSALSSTEDLTFWVIIQDRSLNVSSEVSAVAVVNNPDAVVPLLSYSGENIVVQWGIPPSSFVIDYYEVSIEGTVVAESKSTSYTVKATWVGACNVQVVAVDIAGNRSAVANVEASPSLPAAPVLSSIKTASNQFKLIYSATAGDLPISSYVVSVGSLTSPTEVLEKAGNSSFTTVSENVGGEYIYFVQAKDTAGNLGPESGITVQLEDSTDLSVILSDSQAASGFSGVRTNMVDVDGVLCLPIPDGRTMSEKYSPYANIQAKINAGYPAFLQPSTSTASYVFVLDSGAVIETATVQLLLTMINMVGSVSVDSITLEQSLNNVSYTSISGTSGSGLANNFRYIRASINFSASNDTHYAKLTEIALNLFTAIREESGSFTSTGLAGGDVVPLNQPFADIQTVTVTANNFDAIDAEFDWVDPNPTQFKAQVFNKGTVTRYTGTVGYTVKGI